MSIDSDRRRTLRDSKFGQKARNDLAAILNLMDHMAATRGEWHCIESMAHAHAARLAVVADTFEKLIEDGIEARVSKWALEDECNRLKLQLAKLKFSARCGGTEAQ